MSAEIYKFYATRDWGSNFHPSRITYNGMTGDTVEHIYQACKFAQTDPSYAQQVLTAPTPTATKRLGSVKSRPLDPNWDIVYATDPYIGEIRYKDWIMYSILKVKFSIPHFEQQLLATGDMILVEDSPSDFYWGWRNGGKNMLGKLLMRIRSEIRSQKNGQ